MPVVQVVAQSPKAIVMQMIDSAKSLRGFTAEITKTERIEGELVKQISRVKLSRQPFQLYLYQEYPKEGVEVLWHRSSTKALVNLNSFPWINLSLDPFGSLMRRHQHHTLFDSGFDLMAEILHRELARIGTDTTEHIAYLGITDWQGRPAYHIVMDNPRYHIATYRVELGEDLITIARKLNVNEYAILELNEEIDFYDDVEPGQEIKVPSRYAKKMNLYIDTGYMLPLMIEVFDAEGLYEKYEYRNFVHNPDFADNEFTGEYPEYDF